MSPVVRDQVERFPEFVAVAGLMIGYLLGVALGVAVAGALLGGAAGLGVALWASDEG